MTSTALSLHQRHVLVKRRVILPIAALMGVAVIALIAFLWFGATRQDAMAERRSIEAVRHAVAAEQRRLGLTTRDYSWWDDAVRNLDLRLNPEWADGNVGPYIFNTFGYELSFVIDRADRTVYAHADGARVEADAFATLSHGLQRLTAEARAAPPTEPEPATGLLRAGDDVVVVSASALTPQEGSELGIPAGPRAVLLYARRLTPEYLAGLGEAVQLGTMRLVRPDPTGGTGAGADLPLVAPDGTVLGFLAWDPPRPGRAFLREVQLPLAITVAVLSLFTLLALRHAGQAAEAIAAGENRFRDVADAASDWIWETDTTLCLSYVSDRFRETSGLPPTVVLGQPIEAVLQPADGSRSSPDHLQAVRDRRPFRHLLCRFEGAAAGPRVLRIAGKPVADRYGRFQGYRGTATDITAEVEAESRARYFALHDPLTGLPNGTLLRQHLAQAAAEARRSGSSAAVLCLDLDRFKEINDTLGHAVGDALIRACALRLQESAREADTVARLGGDEFAVLQVGAEQPGGVRAFCQRLLARLAEPFDLDSHAVAVTASIGVALVPDDGEEPEQLIKNADIALYRAKAQGRNTVCFFEPGMDAELRARQGIERDLRAALARRELELHYQPQVDVGSRRLVGVEALARWRHPQRGMVPPIEFISVAEETGLILPLGEWVLRTACAQAAAWPGIGVSVNVSPVQFAHPDLVGLVGRVLDETGLEPGRLELEITERTLGRNAAASTDTLLRLKALGVRIALDDFGTGNPSLRCLQSFPFDKLKIDTALIGALPHEANAGAIARAAIAMGRSLGVRTCAEGVETAAQLAMLSQEGCDEVQGYHVGRPVPAAEIGGLLGRTAAGSEAVA